ncbi:hypothetical protein GXP67_16010 [Rhodocytophaga rosea]|uniref:Uncharacterized protein n=1 Tax=Rhodocytophaga rosea TaxID=2704465 RepID=A0A6C0GJB0_9BACT|nr:hypothetical protein [Rhodocytophaga rosea]QHT68039.1 hypothetical protein GXP67_16010 [Rhodocytophaga rosea]
MQIIISYEVNSKQSAVRDIMKLKGYEEIWTKNEVQYRLPETTLWKEDTTPSQAMEDLKKVARALNIELLGASAAEFTDWEGLQDEIKKEDN